MDRRLQRRYVMMVRSHMRAAPALAAGVASLARAGPAFAATQAAWRFLNNERVSLPALVRPLRKVGQRCVKTSKTPFALLVHDWCKLGFGHAADKRDLVQLTHDTDVGYELTAALLVSAEDGSPLAPMEMHLKTAHGVLSTREPAPRSVSHLEQVWPTMRAARTWGLSKPVVHVIDRESDSVDHYRRWDAHGEKYLIRADDRRVRWNGESWLLSEISEKLGQNNQCRDAGKAEYRGDQARLWVAETEVVLYRPAKKNVRGRKFQRAGRSLSFRLILAQIRDDRGKVLAEWKLLSNVPREWATTEHLAHCYYWRWRIESFFKLLKSHGQQLERWQQETGPAIARRLLIASMACVAVWRLQTDDSPPAQEFKKVLVTLSGRQMKRTRPYTAPALLAGLWTLLSMLALLEHYQLRDLKHLATSLVPLLDTG
jgi:hypothetical protein